MDNQDDDGLLPQAEYTMCLDEIASGDSLFVHVSKPPKEGTKPHKLLKTLNEVCYYSACVMHDLYMLFLEPPGLKYICIQYSCGNCVLKTCSSDNKPREGTVVTAQLLQCENS